GIKKFLKKIDYVGVIAFELFDTGTDLVVNEIAPRVHNSGHYSIEAFNVSQFGMHLLAVTGEKFPELKSYSKTFFMTNLIGNASPRIEFPSPLKGHMHWYGKEKNSLGR